MEEIRKNAESEIRSLYEEEMKRLLENISTNEKATHQDASVATSVAGSNGRPIEGL